MLSFLKKRRILKAASAIASDITPRVADSREWLKACQVDETPRSLVEAAIGQLCVIHKSVLAQTKDEDIRSTILPMIHENFQAEYCQLASAAGMNQQGLVQLVARRLATYDSLMDSSLPDWQLRLSEQLFECISGKRADIALATIPGILFLSRAKAYSEFLGQILP